MNIGSGNYFNDFTDKYNMSLEESKFYLNKNYVLNIYLLARLENCNITLPDTYTIVNGKSVANIDTDDLEKVLRLKRAWKHLANTLQEDFTLNYHKSVHAIVAQNEALSWGEFRTGSVGIYGTKYTPPENIKEEYVMNKFINFMKINSVTKRAIHYMLWCMREQLFWDGNKRTAILCANKILLQNGKGMLIIQEDMLSEFNVRLTEFYNTGDYSVIDNFLYEKCIYGLEKH